MKICIVGAGLAGALLAWRLSGRPGVELSLAPGPQEFDDATAVSGGAVRAYENAAVQRSLALDSLAELLDSPVLQEWSGYRATGSVYLPSDTAGLAGAVSEIEAVVPGSACVLDTAGLLDLGWAGAPDGSLAVLERRAGFVDPDRLRRSVLGEVVAGTSVDVLPHGMVEPMPDGFSLAGERYRFDVVVLATGAATPGLLNRSGLRTKRIQYSVHAVSGWRPTVFCDESTGLYGIPRADGTLLLGLATQAWDVPPTDRTFDPELTNRAAHLAQERFPRLRLGEPLRTVAVPDCYSDTADLRLRPVEDAAGRLFTFTGGSGGAAKTALAASGRAAIQLADTAGPREETTPTLIGWTSQS